MYIVKFQKFTFANYEQYLQTGKRFLNYEQYLQTGKRFLNYEQFLQTGKRFLNLPNFLSLLTVPVLQQLNPCHKYNERKCYSCLCTGKKEMLIPLCTGKRKCYSHLCTGKKEMLISLCTGKKEMLFPPLHW